MNPASPAPALFSPLFIADWTGITFVHFALPAKWLAPHVPHPLDTRDGHAFVSLVSFRMENLRPGRWVPSPLGRACLRSISNHASINLRTYVRGPRGDGIYFLSEWVDNRLSRLLGALTYGLPYRFAHMQRAELPAGGLTQIRVTEPGRPGAIGITVPLAPPSPPTAARPGSLDAFLVERYTACTRRRQRDRCFHIAHRPWLLTRVDLVRTDTSLIEAMHPWFKYAEPVATHVGPGAFEVAMSPPRACGVHAPGTIRDGLPSPEPARAE